MASKGPKGSHRASKDPKGPTGNSSLKIFLQYTQAQNCYYPQGLRANYSVCESLRKE